MVSFVLATGISPSEYKKLTLMEYAEFARQVGERQNGE